MNVISHWTKLLRSLLNILKDVWVLMPPFWGHNINGSNGKCESVKLCEAHSCEKENYKHTYIHVKVSYRLMFKHSTLGERDCFSWSCVSIVISHAHVAVLLPVMLTRSFPNASFSPLSKCYLSVGVARLIEARPLPFSLQRERQNPASAVTFHGDRRREASTQSQHLRLLDITLLLLP